MNSRINRTGMWLSALSVCGAMFTGCIFEEGRQETVPAGPSPIPSMHCADLSPAQQKTGDSLVALAQKLQSSDVEMMVSSRQARWNQVNGENADAAMAYYNQALKAAPGHCGAIFGRALAKSQLLLQDKGLNGVVAQALPKSGSGALAKGAAASLPVAGRGAGGRPPRRKKARSPHLRAASDAAPGIGPRPPSKRGLPTTTAVSLPARGDDGRSARDWTKRLRDCV